MQRRNFIKLIGGAAAAGWPLAVRAQQPERVRRIGVLIPFTADDPEAQARIAVLEQSLRQLGWTVGQNLQIEQRLSGGEAASIRRAAAELVALGPDVLLVIGNTTASLLLQATQPSRVREFGRPGRRRLRSKPSSTGGQRHRFHEFRI